jgi:hypothetical protein
LGDPQAVNRLSHSFEFRQPKKRINKEMRDLINLVEDAQAQSPAQKVISALDDAGVLGHTTRGFMDVVVDGPDRVRLDHIEVETKGSGHGNEMLKALCTLCDEYSVTIVAVAASLRDDGLDGNKLIFWYFRNGFKQDYEAQGEVTGSGLAIIRHPNPEPYEHPDDED